MFSNFLTQLIETVKSRNIKYIYAHNLSGFDGILLMRHLLNYKGAKVDPMIFNGKLMSIKFTVMSGKSVQSIIFKDSYLLLPISLRNLCLSFNIELSKSYFPFSLNDINYIGDFPAYEYWGETPIAVYDSLLAEFKSSGKTVWSFKDEAVKYCKNPT